ncbi:helix-turn-helix domain-containing protein [Streptomyces lunaelactis]|uniref:PucR family transcriptional regulator n=1 Tax=Streptomyces lunaelactis TaxID=1535768 RepID=UPI001584D834|nr:PucR family transcriptional regulator [Streptomyces lunaelactis]NUK70003.1 helix-turn-helix domain-containing protein [Streptomyces lunaelactis]NUK77131.1 helix-turn-helix domain-containing protein [Streptomyces lunaelactis]
MRTGHPGEGAVAASSAWHDVPRERIQRFADRALEQVPELAQDILAAIRREYPGLAFIVGESGEPKALVAIRHALELFVEQMTTGSDRPRALPEMFQDFGRGEVTQGRSLDSLQGIYRLGVRLSWRRMAEIGQQVDIPPAAMYELAESAFEYLDVMVAQSVRGYAEAVARQAGERLRLQRQLVELLLAEHRTDPSAFLAERAAGVGWQLPEKVAVAVLLRPAQEAVAPAVGVEVLLDMEGEHPRMVVPDPEAPGRADLLHRAMANWSGAIGPSVPLAEAATSLRWAETAVGMIEQGLLPQGRLLHCGEHVEALVLLPAGELIDELARRRLAQLGECGGPAHAHRLAETLLAWLETRGGAPEVAARLGVHPQTVRYRLRQLRELWGEDLDDPDRRFELELVLRARRLRGDLVPPPD